MILVDSSVWIDHLRSSDSRLVRCLEEDEVGTHPLVIEELALGSFKKRAVVLDYLDGLRAFPRASHAEVRGLIEAHRLWAKGLGAVDVHLLAAVLLQPGAHFWTRDKRLRSAAAAAGAALVAWS
ncbi:type II toxin-antitoxin system VapC family toxin [Marmoricola sp. RAF53]|uniref:type II toxin-antitoxin system VapC family toxin n=1 Tax=Marmoricola sp. RAF53 TaxID=3233059 RepID=UPI003F9C61E7